MRPGSVGLDRYARQVSSDYSARHLSVLEGLEAVRKRPGMYIGSTDSRGLMHCLWEVIDNSVDEALAGHGDEIGVILHADGSVEVSDVARGIPVDVEPKTGLTGVEVVFTKLHAGGKFGSGSYAASGGLHGVGASVVNALSERLDVEVDRGGKTYAMSFHRGEPGIFDDAQGIGPDAPFTPFMSGSELRVIGKVKKGVTGTRVRYWADRQIFTKDAAFSTGDLVNRARQTAFLVPGLGLTITDARPASIRAAAERAALAAPAPAPATTDADADAESLVEPSALVEQGPVIERFRYEGGIGEFVEHLAVDGAKTDVWRIQGSGTFKETVPMLDDKGHMVSTEVERNCEVDVALRWGDGYETVFRSFVNIIATPKGGTHQAGFEAGLVKSVRTQVEANARKLKVGQDKLEKDDVLAGLTAVLTVRLPEPQFEGQTKEILGTPAVRRIVDSVVSKRMTEILTSTQRNEKAQAAGLLEKVVAEMKTRISARAHKETQRRKNALENSSLPAKLVDCRSNDVEGTELFIVEGDSALGTAKLARNSEYQALLPIRGKILNVQKASVSDMLSNVECASIIQVIGAGSGRTFDLDQARYGKVIIMTRRRRRRRPHPHPAADAVLPLHAPDDRAGPGLRRGAAAAPGRGREPRQAERDDLHVLRAGADDPVEEARAVEQEVPRADPALQGPGRDGCRPARRDDDGPRAPHAAPGERVDDAESAAKVFELLMGNDVAPRKEFIIAGEGLDRERIDA